MSSAERAGDALAVWLDAAEQDARAARSYPALDRSDAAYEAGRRFRQRFMHEELMLAVLAVVQAAIELRKWLMDDPGVESYSNDFERFDITLAALRALVGDASPWADQEADVQPSHG